MSKITKPKTLRDLFSDESTWIKDDLVNDKHTAWCLVGGVMETRIGQLLWGGSNNQRFTRTLKKLANYIEKSFPGRFEEDSDPWMVCATFNNHDKTTFADIRKVIESTKT